MKKERREEGTDLQKKIRAPKASGFDPDGEMILLALMRRRLFAAEWLPASALGFDVHSQSIVWLDFEHPDRRLFGNGSPLKKV